jgi:signal transduction histidine kinase
MNALCNNLLLNSQMEAGRYQIVRESINLSELAASTVREFKERFPERHLISNTEKNIYSAADPFLLQIALNNLIDNAIKYTPKEESIVVSVYEKGLMNCIQVEDHGPGINDVEKKLVFEKYHRIGTLATRVSKGTGLGLYLVKRIATALHASIHVEDNEPRGCRFIITITASEKI